MERILNKKFGFDGMFRQEMFYFKVNVTENMVVKSFHKGSFTGDLIPVQQGTDRNSGLEVAVYRFSDCSAHQYEITDGNESLKFEIGKVGKNEIIWL